MPKTRILCVMSVYQGSSYLNEQLESIYAQKLPEGYELDIFVRDDGSKDESLKILEQEKKLQRLDYEAATNVGCAPSFMLLLKRAKSYDFVCLADQDDVWFEDKLLRALQALEVKDQTKPQFYASEYTYCDQDLNPKKDSHLFAGGLNLRLQLFENMISGNTLVFNKALVELILLADAKDISWHDWWISLVAFAFCEPVLDSRPSLYYRRLQSNTSPAGKRGFELLKIRIKLFLKDNKLDLIKKQTLLFKKLFYAKLSKDQQALLDCASSNNPFKKAFYPKRWRHSLADEFMVRLLMLFNRL